MNRHIKSFLYITIISGSALLLSGCTPSTEKLEKYDQVISEANLFWEAMEYSSAVNKFNEATSLVPSKVDAYRGLTSIFITKNRVDEAKTIIDESANKLDVNDRATLYIDVAQAYYKAKEYDKALNTYSVANGIGDTAEKANLGLAKVHLQKGEVEKAKGYINGTFNEELRIEATLIHSYIESISDQKKALDLISEVEPTDDWKSSYQEWKDVLESLDEDELYNVAKLSHSYINAGYPYLAISVLSPMKESMSEYIEGIYLLGKAYYDYGDYQSSVDTLSGVTGTSEINQYLYWTMARDYYFLDDINNSFSYYDTAITYAGDDAQEVMYQEYLDLLIENDQLNKAQEVLRKAEKVFDDPWIDIAYMKVSEMMGEDEKVDYYADRVVMDDLEGKFKSEYLYLKSKMALENSQLEEAKRNLDLFFAVDKFDPRYNLLMGKLSIQEGNTDEAKSYLEKSIEYDLERIVTDDAQKLLAQVD